MKDLSNYVLQPNGDGTFADPDDIRDIAVIVGIVSLAERVPMEWAQFIDRALRRSRRFEDAIGVTMQAWRNRRPHHAPL
jgi:hypothetical protein